MPVAKPQGKMVMDMMEQSSAHTACGHRRTAEGLPPKLVRLVRDVPALHEYAEKDPELCVSVEHRGQRKLLNTEIEFLTHVLATFGADKCRRLTVVYAGSAPGTHLRILLRRDLFGGMFAGWHLYDDPRRFDREVVALDGVSICPRRGHPRTPEGYFDAVLAASYSSTPGSCVFISDIRTDDTSGKRIAYDNEQMRRWVMAMRPAMAMLKFRLPFPVSPRAAPRTYPVLRGHQVLQTWAPRRSTETRIWVTAATCRTGATENHEDREYETRMNTFNQFYRPKGFVLTGAAAAPAGACRCYDHAAERLIYAQCLRALSLMSATTATTATTAKRSSKKSLTSPNLMSPKKGVVDVDVVNKLVRRVDAMFPVASGEPKTRRARGST